MVTPFDWQEGIGHRAQYVESRLRQGIPVLGLSLPEGVVLATLRKNSRKLFDIYDRLAFGAIGLQSDIETVRVAAIDFAHREGYARSEEDVSGFRVASALSAPMKRTFGDFNSAPLVIRALLAEVGEAQAEDLFYVLEFDGDYARQPQAVALCGDPEHRAFLEAELKKLEGSAAEVGQAMLEVLHGCLKKMDNPGNGLTPEIALLSRRSDRENRFLELTP
jgi:proteasome alpha subunit